MAGCVREADLDHLRAISPMKWLEILTKAQKEFPANPQNWKLNNGDYFKPQHVEVIIKQKITNTPS